MPKANLNTSIDPGREAGVSLVELLVVVAIIAVVASLALMQRGSANEQFQRQNISRELKVVLERARFDSVKRRAANTVLQASVTVNATSFTLVTDVNMDGDLSDPADSHTTDFAGENITIVPQSGTLPITISYNQRGEPDVTNPTFVVCNGTCDFNTDTASNADIVLVTPTGTVNLLPGGADLPQFSSPGFLPVAGSDIRTDTIIQP